MAVSTDTASRLSTDLIGVIKLVSSIKAHVPRIHEGIEPSAYPVLFTLVEEPRRVSTLATCVHSDVSTVSRQVSALVAQGLAEKVPDPQDGRVAMVSLSAEGVELVERLKVGRGRWFQRILSDWEPEEAERLIELLEKLTETITAAHESGTLFEAYAAYRQEETA
ncbi:hypothetical protein BN12_70005 [Nostocoides japonicum T1-X7]|uniref:HTH marR-type domain-containing protein n=1 Tax=Nostocoides japonicum T1-X7 TaxID=1194083 RepID=A0A077M757_9MICO|nr:MarR family transcriptional regulator [Tetrasphaera japonica]CCH79989.1 hypothetical protein BN12_70005 [Tetrasphaera japonica T1-X7]